MAQDTPVSKQEQFIVRLPDGMRDRIKEAAKENGRSMNAEIVQRLEASFELPPPMRNMLRPPEIEIELDEKVQAFLDEAVRAYMRAHVETDSS